MTSSSNSSSKHKAKISGDTRATLTEDDRKNTAKGDLDVKDADKGQDQVQAITSKAGTYGKFSINAKGEWTYVLDNSLAATQALAEGKLAYDKFVVLSKDGSAKETVTITVKGRNDETRISGTTTGTVKEGASVNTATGKLVVQDADAGEGAVISVSNKCGKYGSFSMKADGTWTYTLDNGNSTVQKLAEGQKLTETFTVYTKDGGDDKCDDDRVSQKITITIIGTNDSAVIGGTATGTLVEDCDLSACGQLTIKDIEYGQAKFQAATVAGDYGTLAINSCGEWVYKLANSSAKVQELAAGETVTDTITVKSADGTTKQIKLTVTGTNDKATITGNAAGTVAEDGTLTASGALTVSDVDRGEAGVRAQQNVAGSFGSFSISADGQWTYVLDNSAAHVQALNSGELVTETFTVTSHDGTATKSVSIQISGSDETSPLVAVDDRVAPTVLTFEAETFSALLDELGTDGVPESEWGYIIETHEGFQVRRVLDSGGLGAYVAPFDTTGSSMAYTVGKGASDPGKLTLNKMDGSVFALDSASILAGNTPLAHGGLETVSGYRQGVLVAEHQFLAPDHTTTPQNKVQFLDADWLAVDTVVFSMAAHPGVPAPSAFMMIDDIALLRMTNQALDINVTANDVNPSGGMTFMGDFSATSAYGAAITLNLDGTFHYDPTTSPELQALAQGTSVTDTFTYVLMNDTGEASNTATVSIQLVGSHANLDV